MKTSQKKMKRQIEFLKTGIKGFDEVFGPGIPRGRALLVLGAAGTGKTVLINSFLYHGIVDFNQGGVFVTFEESPADIIENAGAFGWDYEALIRAKKLAFVDASPDHGAALSLETGPCDLSPLIARIKYAIKTVKATRVVIDSVSSLLGRFKNEAMVREALARIYHEMKKAGVTALVTGEKQADSLSSRFGVEEFVADGAIELSVRTGQQKVIRELNVVKVRGAGFRSGRVEFEITEKGLEVFPKIPADPSAAKTNFKIRKAFGIPRLDAALGGGIPQAQTCLLTGNTGTGKTTLSFEFLAEGFRRGESAVFVTLEESRQEVMAATRERGLDLRKYERLGRLKFVGPGSLIDVSNDRLLYSIVGAVQEVNAQRVVFDSISSLMSATMSTEEVRQFFLQLIGYFKSRGVTALITYLTGDTFGAEAGQLLGGLETNLMRLSSIIDGIILLRYTERDQAVCKLLNILKLRGSFHSRDIIRYEITSRGIEIGEKFQQ